MWFAALSPACAEPRLPRLLRAVLAGDRDVLRLLRATPFPGQLSAWGRVRRYRCQFASWSRLRRSATWWERTPAGFFSPPASLGHPTPGGR